MLFYVKMDVHLPSDMDSVVANELKAREKEFSAQLQRQGKWRHIWRIAGLYSNISIFDVEDPQELHDLLTRLPLFPYMTITLSALCRHPSSVREGDM